MHFIKIASSALLALFAAAWIIAGIYRAFFEEKRPAGAGKTYDQLAAENAARHNETIKK